MKKTLIKFSGFIALLLVYNFSAAQTHIHNALPKWAFGGFVRPPGVNPVISPNLNSVFIDPMTNKPARWEANYTFNPAAAIKDHKIGVLYRSEEKTGVEIGTRTSRIGYAESSDGLIFKRNPKPVLYPANDSQKEFEWPGGCEDPR